MTFNPNIPNANDLLSNSQGQLKINNQALDTSFGVDHVPFSDLSGFNGYHKVIRQFPFITIPPTPADPPLIAAINQVYSRIVTPDSTGALTDTQMFVESGNGVISQLTGSLLVTTIANTPTLTEGYQWIGGVLLQWGRVDLSTNPTSGTVTFKDRGGVPNPGMIPFPNNCLNVQLTLRTNLTNLLTGTVSVKGSITKSSFNWQYIGLGPYDKFYWFAIGY